MKLPPSSTSPLATGTCNGCDGGVCCRQTLGANVFGASVLYHATCRVCGVGFATSRYDAKTCTSTCRQRLHRGGDLAYLAALKSHERRAHRTYQAQRGEWTERARAVLALAVPSIGGFSRFAGLRPLLMIRLALGVSILLLSALYPTPGTAQANSASRVTTDSCKDVCQSSRTRQLSEAERALLDNCSNAKLCARPYVPSNPFPGGNPYPFK